MKTILLSFFLLVSSILFGQDSYYTYQVQSGIYSKSQSKWIWDEVKSQEIEIKLEGKKVIIYNNSNTILTTYEDLGEKKGVDDDDDEYKSHSWYAYDDKNRKCKFIMTWYSNITLIVYSVIYNDVAFRFYIRTNKLSDFK